MKLHKCSRVSLYIEMSFNGNRLSTGTGFLTKINNGIYLLTNRHNVTGRDQNNGQPLHDSGGLPNQIKIFHQSLKEGEWIPKVKALYGENEDPLWIEHPIYKNRADFIALKLGEIIDFKNTDIRVACFDISKILGISLNPSESISVIGFPFGKSAGENENQYYPIWLNGFIASEICINYNNLPVFLIDARTREGQSGSPVWAIRDKAVFVHNNETCYYDNVSEFLGIYSGRINEKADIGYVWKASAVLELVKYIKEITK